MASPFDQFDKPLVQRAAGAPPASPFDQFDNAPDTPQEAPAGPLRRALGDPLIGLAQGVIGAGQTLYGMADAATGGLVDRATKPVMRGLSAAGEAAAKAFSGSPAIPPDFQYAPDDRKLSEGLNDATQALDEYKSPQLRAANKIVQDVNKDQPPKTEISDASSLIKRGGEELGDFGRTVGAMAQNPSTVVDQIAQSAPVMVGMLGALRKIGAGVGARAMRAVDVTGLDPAAATAARAAARDAAIERWQLPGGGALLAQQGIDFTTSGSQQSQQAKTDVLDHEKTTQAMLDASPQYQDLRAAGLSPDAAREKLGDLAMMKAFAVAGSLSALATPIGAGVERKAALAGMVQPQVRKLLGLPLPTGTVGKIATKVGEFAKSVGQEGLQETLQTAGEQIGTNVGEQVANPNLSILDQVGSQAASGGFVGAAMGGGMHVVGEVGGHAPAATPPPPPVSPAAPPGPLVNAVRGAPGAVESAQAATATQAATEQQTADQQAEQEAATARAEQNQKDADKHQAGFENDAIKAAEAIAAAKGAPEKRPTIDTATQIRHIDALDKAITRTEAQAREFRASGDFERANTMDAKALDLRTKQMAIVDHKNPTGASNAAGEQSTEPVGAHADGNKGAGRTGEGQGVGGGDELPQAAGTSTATGVAGGAGEEVGLPPSGAVPARGEEGGGLAPQTTPEGVAAPESTGTAGAGKAEIGPHPATQFAGRAVYDITTSDPLKRDDVAIAPEDARFDLETMRDNAARGKLTHDQFAQSPIGARLDTGTLMSLRPLMQSDPVGTLQTLIDRLDQAGKAETGPPIVPGSIDEPAHDGAATSPTNTRTEPSPDQKEAGNYAVGKEFTLQGQRLRTENPHTSVRSNLAVNKIDDVRAELAKKYPDQDYGLAHALEQAKGGDYEGAIKSAKAVVEALSRTGEPDVANRLSAAIKGAWATPMQAHYGRILGTVGNDKDHLDWFAKPGTPLNHDGPIFVIDQNKTNGQFDEHKVMFGYGSQEEAVAAYKAHYPKDWKVGPVHQTTTAAFKEWTRTGDTTKPFGQSGGAQVKALALQAQKDAGWNPDWPFIPADLGNADFRERIANDPSMSAEEKHRVFAAGEKLGVVPKGEQAAAATGFTTAKGSTYVVHEDGTTTRNKSFHPEHGAQDQGPQPRSHLTGYVDDAAANKLALIQATHPHPMVLTVDRAGNRAALMWAAGPDAGKMIEGTLVTMRKTPTVGSTPVEAWRGNITGGSGSEYGNIHFGNRITAITTGTAADKDAFIAALSDKDAAAAVKKLGIPPSTKRDRNDAMLRGFDIEKIKAALGTTKAPETTAPGAETKAPPQISPYVAGELMAEAKRRGGTETQTVASAIKQANAGVVHAYEYIRGPYGEVLRAAREREAKGQTKPGAETKQPETKPSGIPKKPLDVARVQTIHDRLPDGTKGKHDLWLAIEAAKAKHEADALDHLQRAATALFRAHPDWSELAKTLHEQATGERMPTGKSEAAKESPAEPKVPEATTKAEKTGQDLFSEKWNAADAAERRAMAVRAGIGDDAATKLADKPWDQISALTRTMLERKNPAEAKTLAKGDRVELVGDSVYAGRHGEVAERIVTTSRPIFGGGAATEHISYYVKTDNGFQAYADASQLQAETAKPESVVPDIAVDGGHFEPPQNVFQRVSTERVRANKAREAAARARLNARKSAHLREATEHDQTAARYQAKFDAWAEKYPEEAKAIRGEARAAPTAAPQTGGAFTYREGQHSKTGAALHIVSMNERADRDEYKRIEGVVKGFGGHWSSFVKGFIFQSKATADQFLAAEGGAPEVKPEAKATESARSRLTKIAESRDIRVDDGLTSGFVAGGGVISIPSEDAEVASAISPDHVMAHELAHALIQKRGVSWSGFPVAEMRRQVPGYDELVAISKAFRPGVWNNADERIKAHARKANEVMADAVASVLLGTTPFSEIEPAMTKVGITARDLGLPEATREEAKPEAGWKPIGKNANGTEVYEDERGVRSVITANNVRITEPVLLTPTRAGIQTHPDTAKREARFKTAEESKPQRFAQPTRLPGESYREHEAKGWVVDAMNGDITVDALIDKLRGTELAKGTLAAITERLGERMSAAQQQRLLAGKPVTPQITPPRRSDGYEVVPAADPEWMVVREPRAGQNGGHQNLARFKVGKNGQATRIEHFFESESTRGPVMEAINRWQEQQTSAEPDGEAALRLDKEFADLGLTAQGRKQAFLDTGMPEQAAERLSKVTGRYLMPDQMDVLRRYADKLTAADVKAWDMKRLAALETAVAGSGNATALWSVRSAIKLIKIKDDVGARAALEMASEALYAQHPVIAEAVDSILERAEPATTTAPKGDVAAADVGSLSADDFEKMIDEVVAETKQEPSKQPERAVQWQPVTEDPGSMSMGAAANLFDVGDRVRRGDEEGTVQPRAQGKDGDYLVVRFDGDTSDTLIDARLAELQVGSKAQTKAGAAALGSGRGGVLPNAPAPKTAGAHLGEAAGHAKTAALSGLKGLDALFGRKKGTLGSGPSFDEDTWRQAKPYFDQAFQEAVAAGKSLKDFVREIIADYKETIRPYLSRWFKETQEAVNAKRTGTDGERNLPPVGPDGVRGHDQAGGNDKPATAPANAPVVGGEQTGDVRSPEEAGGAGADGGRPAKQDVGGGEGVSGSGNGADGRNGASGAGVADAGSGDGSGRPGQPVSGQPAAALQPGLGNYHIGDPDALFGGGPKARFAKNRAAIEALNAVIDESREATPEERDAIAAYTGWGSFGQELFNGSWDYPRPQHDWKAEDAWLREHMGQDAWESAQRSIVNAHYTDPPTVQAMWRMLERMGFTGGRVLEPSIGVGNFFGLMPRELMARSTLAGIELDSTTGRMAQILYPDANIQIKGYQDSKTADGFYDLVIGNWPFLKDGPSDRRYNALSLSLHDYFYVKALDQVRAGGFVVGITSNGTMDKRGTTARNELAKKGELVAAFRLPTGAFQKYAGTKVVTDIIILRKRATPLHDASKEGWIQSHDVPTPAGPEIHVNEYWAAHPDNVLGEMTWGRGTTTGQPGMIVNRQTDFPAKLAGLPERLPEGLFTPTPRKNINYVTNNTKDRERSIIVGDKGLMVVQGEYLAPLKDLLTYAVKSAKETAEREKQIAALVQMRKAYGALVDAERDAAANVEDLRKALAKQYRAFTKAYGPVNESYGLSVFNKIRDPFYPMLAALETSTGRGKARVYAPARILSEATMRGKKALENPSIADAFVLSRNASLDVDPEAIAKIAKRPAADVIKELTESGAIFLTPAGHYEVSDVYLSGNVRRKMREAAEAAAAGQDMARNIEALTKVMPKDVPYFKIEAKLGAPWVSAKQYEAFVHELLGLSDQQKPEVKIEHRLGSWRVEIDDHSIVNKPEATTIHGVPFYRFNKLLKAAMNNTAITIRVKDDDGNMVVDPVASAEANAKVAALRERFPDWLWSDADRRLSSETEYNEAMNAIADVKFDGSFLAFSGMALQRGDDPFSLREHQVNAIWRGLVNKLGIYAHEVGTGKTYTIGGLAVESRRYGIAKKPLLFAHNANSATVAREVGEMYPGAKVLYIDNLDPGRIDVTMRQIANDDWDLVVVPHSLIDRFALTEETLTALSRDEIAALEQEAIEAAEADNASLSVGDMDDEKAMKKVRSSTAKELVKARNAILKKIQDMAIRSSKEDAVSFEDLGVDMILVDEAHEFKKPPLATRMNLKGLNKGTSNRAISLRFLTDYVKGLNGGTGVHLFTGTPITNTLNEIYNLQRFVADSQMARDGIKDWDSWFNTFADSVTDVELTAAATYEPVTRLASFVNVAEMRRMIGGYTDIVFADDMPEFKPRETATGKTMRSEDLTPQEKDELLNGRSEKPIGRPYKHIINDVAPMSPAQQTILALLVRRATAFKTAGKKARREMMLGGHVASPVIVEGDAAKAALDPRMYDLTAPDDPNLKINRAAKNILTHYKESPLATQAVFVENGYNSISERAKRGPDDYVLRNSDGKSITERIPTFNLVEGLIAKLVAGGIPRSEIAVVGGTMTKEKRKETADKMNTAETRVVIGLSTTLGTGVNMQDNLRAMHHLDAPWMPGLLEQRNGRGWRQGNKWNTVLEYRYITDRVDGRRWQVLAIKDRFIKAFLTADENVRVIDGDAASIEEGDDILGSLSEAAGDPRILLKEKYKKDVERLQSKLRFHDYARGDAQSRMRQAKVEVERLGQLIGILDEDYAVFAAEHAKPFSAEFDGKTYTERKAFDHAISDWVADLTPSTTWVKLGNVLGFKLYGRWPHKDAGLQLELRRGTGSYDVRASAASMEATLRGIPKRADEMRQQQQSLRESIPRLDEASRAPFPREADLRKRIALLDQLESDLAANPVPAPIWLRQGAPIRTTIFAKGREVEVEGHQWSKDGFFVLVNTDEGVRRVPYADAKDASGLPVYEPHPFAPPAARGNTLTVGTPFIERATGTRFKAQSEPYDDHGVQTVRGIDANNHVRQLRVADVDIEKPPEAAVIPLLEEKAAEPIEPLKEAVNRWVDEGGRGDPLFSAERSDLTFGAGLSVKDVQSVYDHFTRLFETPPPVHIAPISAWPMAADSPNAKHFIKIGSKIRGAYYKGEIWLDPTAIATKEAALEVVKHELTHGGLDRLLGSALLRKTMQAIYDSNADVKARADVWMARNQSSDQALGAEEAIARIAEKGEWKAVKGWDLLVARIKMALRRMGLTFKWTDADVAGLISAAQAKIEKGTGVGATKLSQPNPTWYSALAEALPKAPWSKDGSMGVEALRMWIAARTKDGTFKADEVAWSGLDDYLKLQGGKVARSDVQAFLKDNGVKVTETTLGEDLPLPTREVFWERDGQLPIKMNAPQSIADPESRYRYDVKNGKAKWVDENGHAISTEEAKDIAGQWERYWSARSGVDTKFGAHQLPGGENYRELLLTLPPEKPDAAVVGKRKVVFDKYADEINGLHARATSIALTRAERDAAERDYENVIRIRDQEAEMMAGEVAPQHLFHGGHFDQPNVLAHIRFNDRTDADGKRVLFIEELQSDWAQKGRREGFKAARPQSLRPGSPEAIAALGNDGLTKQHEGMFGPEGAQTPITQTLRGNDTGRIPAAPFVQKTEAWTALALKRMIRYAAENGYDRIAWTTGAQQSARYDLSHHVSEVRVAPIRMAGDRVGVTSGWRVTGKSVDGRTNAITHDIADLNKLPEIIGKDAAEKVAEQFKAGEQEAVLRGLDLKVGGAGMVGFYDKIVPSVANDVLRKLGGGKVGETSLSTRDGIRGNEEFTYHVETVLARDGGHTSYVATKDGERIAGPMSGSEAHAWLHAHDPVLQTKQPSIDITPQLREKAMQGMPLFSRQAQTDTPEFKRWFGKSVVTVDGKPGSEPLAVHHGTDRRFNAFKTDGETGGAYFFGGGNEAGQAREMAATYGSRVIDAYIKLENPFMSWSDDFPGTDFDELRKQGYDGAIFRAENGGPKQYVVFSPTSIKSATKNSGAFDGSNPDIRYSLARTQTETPAFKKWFDKSVVTESGKPGSDPLAVYHSTDAEDFTTFDTMDYGSWFAERPAASNVYSEKGHGGAPRTITAFLSIQRPLLIPQSIDMSEDTEATLLLKEINERNKTKFTLADIAAEEGETGTAFRFIAMEDGFISAAKAAGFDGIRALEQGEVTWNAFSPEQIKSATGNSGAFDPNNPDIRHSLGPYVEVRTPDFVTLTKEGEPFGVHATEAEAKATAERIGGTYEAGISVSFVPDHTITEPHRAAALQRLRALERKIDAGEITDERYRAGVQEVIAHLEQRNRQKENRKMASDRRRGPEWILARMQRGLADGEVSRDAFDFTRWLLQQNPNLAEDLGISIKGQGPAGTSGNYNPANRVMSLFTTGGPETAVHEILHHTEPMMPPEVQDGIAKEWEKAWDDTMKRATPEVRRALMDMMMARFGNKTSRDRMLAAFKSGVLKHDEHYQLYSPSEFWAVNGTRILSNRELSKDSWVLRARQWLRELVSKVQSLLGMRSDAPVLRALRSVLASDGTVQNGMLGPIGFQDRNEIRYSIDDDGVDASSPGSAAGTINNATFRAVGNTISDLVKSDRVLNRLISKFNTPHHIAQTHPEFKPVYDEGQAHQYDVSRIAHEGAELAPGIVPLVDKFSDLWKKHAPAKIDMERTMDAVMNGTLRGGGNPLLGRIFSDEELATAQIEVRDDRGRPTGTTIDADFEALNAKQIEYYHEALASAAHSLEETAKGLVFRQGQIHGFTASSGDSLDIMVGKMVVRADSMIEDEKLRLQLREEERAARVAAAPVEIREATQNGVDVEAARDKANVDKLVASLEGFKEGIKDIQSKTESLIAHGYFPAMRFGQYAVNVAERTADGYKELEFYRFDSQAQANAAKRELEARFSENPNAVITSSVMNTEKHKMFAGLNLDALQVFAKYLVDDEGRTIGLDPVLQSYFREAVSERSSLTRNLHRKGILGYSTDLPRVLKQFTISSAQSAAGNYHSGNMLRHIAAITHGDLQMYADRFRRYMQDPKEEAQGLRGFLATYYILGSVAFGAVNITQPLLSTAPYLTKTTSWAHAMAALGSAAKDYVGGLKDLGNEEREDMQRATKEGTIAPQEIHQIRAETQASMLGDSKLWNRLEGMARARGLALPAGSLAVRKAMVAWGSIYSMTEAFNRSVTFLAAYRIAKEKGFSREDAFDFATEAVQSTQFTYNRGNRSEASRGTVGSIIMTFKSFNVSYIELAKRLYDTDKKAFAVLMLTLMALAGTAGLPFADDIDDILDTIGQWMGYDTNMKKAKRQTLNEFFMHFVSQELAGDITNIVQYGISGIPGVPFDVANRMGMQNIIPGSSLFKTAEPDKTKDLVTLLGPAATLAQNVGRAVEGVATGNLRATRGLLPIAFQNIVQAVDMAETGSYRDQLGRKVMDVDAIDAAFKALGFQPNVVARESRIIGQNQQDVALQKVMESSIVGQWAQGLYEKDPETVKDAISHLQNWNRANPEMPVMVKASQVAERVKQMSQTRENRFIKSTPMEVRGEVARDLRGS